MSRLEEIKKRLSLTNQSNLYADFGNVRKKEDAEWIAEFSEDEDAVFFAHARNDIEYLLSKLEIAAKMFITLELHAEARKHRDIDFETVENLCSKALQQLRS